MMPTSADKPTARKLDITLVSGEINILAQAPIQSPYMPTWYYVGGNTYLMTLMPGMNKAIVTDLSDRIKFRVARGADGRFSVSDAGGKRAEECAEACLIADAAREYWKAAGRA